ncbi:hypothetical protein HMPREF0277_1915 [Corynebacterium accolens ATCC 49726]|nr:hypothetical protein HMPREF0276_1674 [Corynebacterium accolens ATCC 49725]EFM43034.1 hypothetical protein HMPREF0277_1915 [Corynebacterium accolens ATCC 49726]
MYKASGTSPLHWGVFPPCAQHIMPGVGALAPADEAPLPHSRGG